MNMKKLLIILCVIITQVSSAQELNCVVSVLTPQIQATDKTIYETLKTNIREFMNNRKWTGDKFLNQERIECSIVITISERTGVDQFKATIQIQARRPVYKSSYSTPVINHLDQDFTFKYIQDQVIDFDEANNTFNLTSVLAYYAYIIIGMDYDTFSPEGGTLFYQKAQNIVNNSQSSVDRGWKSFEGNRNRYWLVENFLNPTFKPVRSCLYTFHRLGLDQMSVNATEARTTISTSLKDMKPVYQDKPNSFLMQVFFNTKADEIVNLYSGATQEEKMDMIPVLSLIDPANIAKYEGILTAGNK
jgi:hypothetical protein